jgi:hypothetical protein
MFNARPHTQILTVPTLLCDEHAVVIWFQPAGTPTGPAASDAASKAGQMAAPGYVPSPNFRLRLWGSTDEDRTGDFRVGGPQKQTFEETTAVGGSAA